MGYSPLGCEESALSPHTHCECAHTCARAHTHTHTHTSTSLPALQFSSDEPCESPLTPVEELLLSQESKHHYSSSNEVQVAQSCRTVFDPTKYTVHGILQARILE